MREGWRREEEREGGSERDHTRAKRVVLPFNGECKKHPRSRKIYTHVYCTNYTRDAVLPEIYKI